MAKVVKFPIPQPEKLGFEPVRKTKPSRPRKGQLNLFNTGRIIKLNQLSTFDEALILHEQGDSRAKDLYLHAIEEGDCKPDAYCNLGILESQGKNYSKAMDCFTRCLKEDPRHFEAHYNLANLYAEVGNLDLAKIHYEMSIEIEPDFPNNYFNLGLTLALNKELDKAIESLDKYRKYSNTEDHLQVDELINNLSRTLRA